MRVASSWTTLILAAVLHALSLGHASAARAYSDPFLYTEPAELGGGAGRWFTGSSADGYGCEVCHTGGAGVDLQIGGVPLDGFVPGSSYELAIAWPPTVQHLTLIAELADEARNGVGTITLPRGETRQPIELCTGELMGAPASDVHVVEPGRQLLSVIDCGARMVRFQWTAPAMSPERVWLHVGFVAADHDATPAGDAVTMVKHPLPVAGQKLGTHVVAQSGCSVTQPGSRRGAVEAGTWLGLGLLGARRRRRTVRSRGASAT
jgi:MYXO-CTERM domain-containing protein